MNSKLHLLGIVFIIFMSGIPDIRAQGLSAGAGPTFRSFHMGFTPLPYDYSDKAFTETYRRISQYGDIISHHLDEGVPWLESLNGAAYPAPVQKDLERRKNNTPESKKVFLSVTPLALTRVELAGNWGNKAHMPLPEDFAGKPLDHPKVIKAFTNYCLRMIAFFKPSHMAYAIEISDLASSPALKTQFVTLAREVYSSIKRKHPSLKVFPTFTLGDKKALKVQANFIKSLLPYMDVMSVSTYPYVWDGIGGDANRIPADWFFKIAALAPGKPFAVAETGFLADTYSNLWQFVWIPASPDDQKRYVERLLKEASQLSAEFIIWYVPMDYDLLWEKMKEQGADRWLASWMRTGLWDANEQPRPALEPWQNWYALQRRNR